MEELELLEIEMKLIHDNIKRLKSYVKDNESSKYKPITSHVFEELRHRVVAFKQRITVFNHQSTSNLFK